MGMKKNCKTDKIETLCVQAGYTPKVGEPRVAPIVQSTTFYYEEAEQLANLFDLKDNGYFYSRLGNPTCGVLEDKVCALEGGVGALCTSSGQSANMTAILNVCSSGDHIVCSRTIYGGTSNLFSVTLKRMGVDITFVKPDATIEELESAIQDNTKVIFGETIANPAITVLNFEEYAFVAKKYGILFVVDNTLATPIHARPLELGANIVTHSTTKYMDGHATSVGGIIVEGKFNFKNNPRYKTFNEPDDSYHGLVYADIETAPFTVKARVQLIRDTGMMMSPMNAFLTNLGTETLHLRMERTSSNALKVAEFLKSSDKIEFVKYPYLVGDKEYNTAVKYLKGGAGGMISFGLKGGRDACEKFISNLQLLALVTHVADLRSSVIHPASTTHRQLSSEGLIEAGVPENLIRLSIGIEHIDDILQDIKQAIEKI